MERYTVTVPEPVYPPQEDSELLFHIIQEMEPTGRVLDMGTGSGILALAAAETADTVVAADINVEACNAARRNAAENNVDLTVHRSDLFDAVGDVFDIVLFNAPYIPVDEDVEGSEAWAGGGSGRDVIKPFIEQVGDYLTPNGVILLVISSRTGLPETRELARQHGFDTDIAAAEKLPWETLYVLRLQSTR